MKRNGYRRIVVGLLVVFGLVLVAEVTGFRDFVTSGRLQVVIEQSGTLAPILFAGIYAIATVLFIPGTPLTLLGGALFGPVFGTVYVVFGATVGALGAFVLARYFGGSLIKSGTSQVVKRLQSYDERLCNNGLVTVLILRLIPLFPFNGLNFGLGLTRLKTSTYVLGTFIGIIPGTFAYVYFGASLTSFNPIQIGVAVVGLLTVSLLGKYLLAKSNHGQHGK
jgi:uncharacterized membrane protein YdjX (TVP38/TMEM64 family)